MPEPRTDKLRIGLTNLPASGQLEEGDSAIFVTICHNSLSFLLKAFGKPVEGFTPALLSALMLWTSGDTNMFQGHFRFAILLFQCHFHQHFEWKIRTHAMLRSRDNIAVLVSKTICKDKTLHGNYFAINACAPVFLSLRRAHTVKIFAADAQVHLAKRTRILFWPPPTLKVFGLRPRLPHELTRRIENACD